MLEKKNSTQEPLESERYAHGMYRLRLRMDSIDDIHEGGGVEELLSLFPMMQTIDASKYSVLASARRSPSAWGGVWRICWPVAQFL